MNRNQFERIRQAIMPDETPPPRPLRPTPRRETVPAESAPQRPVRPTPPREKVPAETALQRPVHSTPPPRPTPETPQQRVRRLLRSPDTLRDAMLLHEVLGPPRGLRH